MLLLFALQPILAQADDDSPAWVASVAKIMIILVLAPMWIPVLKELWKEVNGTLAEDGGVFGEAPDASTGLALNLQRERDGKNPTSVLLADRDKKPNEKGRRGARSSATRKSRRSF
jgi:hypothetical protein